jgi:hypothetical protein
MTIVRDSVRPRQPVFSPLRTTRVSQPPACSPFGVSGISAMLAQSIASLIRHLPIVLTVLVLLLYGAAVYLARGRRRRTLRSIGFAFIVAGAIVLIARSLAGTAVVDALAHTEAVKPAVDAVWSIGTSLLVTVASSAIAFGILVVVGAWLAGPTRLAVTLRREVAPYAGENRGAVYAGAGVVLVALIAWAPIAALRKPVGILLFIVLFAVGTEILRRQTVREFPDAQVRERGDGARGKNGAGGGPGLPRSPSTLRTPSSSDSNASVRCTRAAPSLTPSSRPRNARSCPPRNAPGSQT